MKRIFIIFFALASVAFAQQPKNVQKTTGGALTEGFDSLRTHSFLSGANVTFSAGSNLTVSGTLGGTPTGGTLNLSNVGVTLGNTTVSTLNVTAFGTGTLLGANGGTGVANTGKTITLGGNLTTSGAYTTTLTTTGNTSVTLPTTGTLATTAQITGTNSGTNTGDQNVFPNIVVSGQTTVTANSTTGNLTLVAGDNIVLTTNNTNKSVTINSTGGGGDSIPGGVGALWPTSGVGSPPTGYFEAGQYGTTAQTALGAWSVVVKSLGTLATPTVSPAAGEITDGSTITFSSTDAGVTFRHTTSGTDPTYTTGTTGATTTLSGNTTYEFIATKAGYPPSAVASVAYTVTTITYLLNEGAEGGTTPSGWTDTGGPNWAFGTPLLGTYSLRTGSFASTYYTHASGYTELHGYMLIQWPSAIPSSTTTFAGFRDNSGSAIALIRINSSGQLIPFSVSDGSPTTDAMTAGVTYQMRFGWTSGGTTYVEFAAVGDSFTGSGNKYQQKTGSSTGTAIRYIVGSGGSSSSIHDRMLTSTTQIGSNP